MCRGMAGVRWSERHPAARPNLIAAAAAPTKLPPTSREVSGKVGSAATQVLSSASDLSMQRSGYGASSRPSSPLSLDRASKNLLWVRSGLSRVCRRPTEIAFCSRRSRCSFNGGRRRGSRPRASSDAHGWSEWPRQIAPPIHDANNLDFCDRAVVRIWVSFVQDEIRPHDEHARSRPDIRAARSKARILGQAVDPGTDGLHRSRRCCWIIDGNRQPDVFQITLGSG
jgi:hypothetical protein